MTAADFRRIALSFDGAEEGSHMGAPELQSQFVAQAPDMFLPVAGGWGRMGAAYPPGESESRHADGRVAHRVEATRG